MFRDEVAFDRLEYDFRFSAIGRALACVSLRSCKQGRRATG
ncbi:MAG: hypothetical protein NZ455_02675 [Bacteroidia bacterium]|nr:hypothetical protein [Bacteroidia bacterium]